MAKFKRGDQVRVVRDCNKYGMLCRGLLGRTFSLREIYDDDSCTVEDGRGPFAASLYMLEPAGGPW